MYSHMVLWCLHFYGSLETNNNRKYVVLHEKIIILNKKGKIAKFDDQQGVVLVDNKKFECFVIIKKFVWHVFLIHLLRQTMLQTPYERKILQPFRNHNLSLLKVY